ncbi:MAG: hypothetical protein H7Z76_04950 [Methylotenera sp.]|nr:hypothetical protein [Flavobacterium sp.]
MDKDLEEFNNQLKKVKKGTKITYRAGNKEPQKDIKNFRKKINSKKSISEKHFRKLFNDPEHVFMKITDDNIYPVCKLRYKRFPFLFLEPNPITFYYSIAFDVSQQFKGCHLQMKKKLNGNDTYEMKQSSLAQVYSYLFKINSIVVIFSIMALEAFFNQELPTYGYLNDGSKINKEKIEKWISLKDKLHKIIPKINQVNFTLKHPKKMEFLENLIDLRNELTHLKKKKDLGLQIMKNYIKPY